MHLSSSFVSILLLQLSAAFTRPLFDTFLRLVTGCVFSPKRTVTGMIVVGGNASAKHHSAFHRFFATARWSIEAFGE